jgi:hypothetical protein
VNDDEPPPRKLILIRRSNYLTVSIAEPTDDVRDVEAASRNPTSSRRANSAPPSPERLRVQAPRKRAHSPGANQGEVRPDRISRQH